MKRIPIVRGAGPLVVAVGFLVGAGRAGAAPTRGPLAVTAPKVSGAELFTSGEAKYKAADYAGALGDFTAADARKPSPEAARYIGLCEDKLGHYREAAMAYDRFLAHPPSKLVDEVGTVVARVREIEQMPGTVRIDVQPQGASLTIDGEPERNVAPHEAHLAPGKHLVRARAPEYEALEREVNVSFASTQDVALTLTAAPSPPVVVAPVAAVAPTPPPPLPARVEVVPSTPPSKPVTRRNLAFASAGVAVLGAGLATTFGVLALNNKSDFERHPTLSNSDKGNNDAAYADGAIALTFVAAVTSLVLFLTDDSAASKAEPAHTATLTASPFFTPHGGGGGALIHF